MKELAVLPQAQLIAQAIGQAFSIAYSQFLRENGIDPSQVGTRPSAAASHPHNGDLDHFCNSQNCREVRPAAEATPGRPPRPRAWPRPHRPRPRRGCAQTVPQRPSPTDRAQPCSAPWLV